MEKSFRIGAVSHIDDELLYLSRLRFFESQKPPAKPEA